MLDKGRFDLLQRLLQTAAADLNRAFTATWSTARLRTLLVHACLDDGHQVVESVVPGSPSHASHPPRVTRPADLQAIRRDDTRPLVLDLLCCGSALADGRDSKPTLSLASVHRAIERVSTGTIDALLISAEARAYDALFASVDGRAASRQRQVVATVLPRAANVACEKAHARTLGDVTVATLGREVRAFGLARLACAVYVVPS